MTQPAICPHCRSPVIDTSALASGRIACPHCAEEIDRSMVADQSPEWVAEKIKAFEAQTGKKLLGTRKGDRSKSAREMQTVMDVVTGVNLRWKDNLIQGITIAAATLIGIPIGAAVAKSMRADVIGGLFMGGFGGLLIGLFGSGLVLMIYRMFRH